VKAQVRLRERLKSNQVKVWLLGQARASDDCVVNASGFRDSCEALSENHALCRAVLLAHYLKQHGRHLPVRDLH